MLKPPATQPDPSVLANPPVVATDDGIVDAGVPASEIAVPASHPETAGDTEPVVNPTPLATWLKRDGVELRVVPVSLYQETRPVTPTLTFDEVHLQPSLGDGRGLTDYVIKIRTESPVSYDMLAEIAVLNDLTANVHHWIGQGCSSSDRLRLWQAMPFTLIRNLHCFIIKTLPSNDPSLLSICPSLLFAHCRGRS